MANVNKCPCCGRFCSEKVLKEYNEEQETWRRRVKDVHEDWLHLRRVIFAMKHRNLWQRILNR